MIEINNLTKIPVDKRFFWEVAKKVLKSENRGKENLSVAFVGAENIRKLNKKFRKKDKPTDVLSFSKILNFKEDLAEVIICPSVVKKNSKELGTTFKEELTKILIHGILHTLGYDHEKSLAEEKQMQKKQDYYLKKFFKK